MGAGKSLTAKNLGKLLGREAISTDQMIEAKEKRSIAKIFAESGETYFRQVEKEVVSLAAQEKGVIIDCGGGVIVNPESFAILKETGLVIYLETSPEMVWERVKNNRNRPLLNVPDPLAKIRELLKQRNPIYEQADLTVPTDHKTVDQVAKEIRGMLILIWAFHF